MSDFSQLPGIVTAIGGLGTAAFGLVDASKVVAFGPIGINHIGFSGIKRTVMPLIPAGGANALPRKNVIETLKANWFNGTDLTSQKAIAKSLIKLNLSPENAEAVANVTGVDPAILLQAAKDMAAGRSLVSPQNDVYARFDLIVTALLDETYQRADNNYRNWTRGIAAMVAIALAIFAGCAINQQFPLQTPIRTWQSVLVGLLATPLAPIAKDLSSALATAVNTMQKVKK
jgi:hypothetical protein